MGKRIQTKRITLNDLRTMTSFPIILVGPLNAILPISPLHLYSLTNPFIPPYLVKVELLVVAEVVLLLASCNSLQWSRPLKAKKKERTPPQP